MIYCIIVYLFVMFFHEWETCFNKIYTSNQAFIQRFGLQNNLQICRFHVMKMLKLTYLISTKLLNAEGTF
jgi:hypothetical protein